jgi:fluoride exporter
MIEVIYVSIGGFFGAISRFALSQKIQKKYRDGFPFGTLTVNLLGAFLLGLLFSASSNGPNYLLFGVGFMGAFTTFSTLMLEAEQLRVGGKRKFFYLYLIISFALGFLLSYLGLIIGKRS